MSRQESLRRGKLPFQRMVLFRAPVKWPSAMAGDARHEHRVHAGGQLPGSCQVPRSRSAASRRGIGPRRRPPGYVLLIRPSRYCRGGGSFVDGLRQGQHMPFPDGIPEPWGRCRTPGDAAVPPRDRWRRRSPRRMGHGECRRCPPWSVMRSIMEAAQCSPGQQIKEHVIGVSPLPVCQSAREIPSQGRSAGSWREVGRMFSKPTSRERCSQNPFPSPSASRMVARFSGVWRDAVRASMPPAWNSGGSTWISWVEPAG